MHRTQGRRLQSEASLKNWKSSGNGSDLSGWEQSGKSRWKEWERRWGLADEEDLAGQRKEGDFAGTTQMKAQKQEGQAARLLGKLSKHSS